MMSDWQEYYKENFDINGHGDLYHRKVDLVKGMDFLEPITIEHLEEIWRSAQKERNRQIWSAHTKDAVL